MNNSFGELGQIVARVYECEFIIIHRVPETVSVRNIMFYVLITKWGNLGTRILFAFIPFSNDMTWFQPVCVCVFVYDLTLQS